MAGAGSAALLLTLAGCGDSANTYAPPPPLKVSVAQPHVADVTRYLHATGTTMAFASVDLVARVQGFLQTIDYKDGATVKKDQRLFQIEPDQYQAQLAQAAAAIEQAQSTLTNADIQFKRQSQLVTQAATPQSNVDTATASRDTARAQLTQSKASEQLAQLNLSYTTIKAPFDGSVTAHLADIGALVGYGGPTKLATILQLDPMRVVFTVSEVDMLQIRQSLRTQGTSFSRMGPVTVEVGTQIDKDYPYKGQLDYAEPQLDSATGTITARALLDNKDRALLPGLFVRIRVPVETLREAVTVPASWISTDQQGAYVLVVDGEDFVRQRRIEVTPGEDGRQIVTAGLGGADRVVTGALRSATPGTKVVPIPESSDSAAAKP